MEKNKLQFHEPSPQNLQKISYYKEPSEFRTHAESYEKHRKSLLTMLVFSMIFNFSGITISKVSTGLIGGNISNPNFVSFALFFCLFYLTISYVLLISYKFEKFYLDITNKDKFGLFKESVTKFLCETDLSKRLKDKNINYTDLQCTGDSAQQDVYLIKLELHGDEIDEEKEVVEEILNNSFDETNVLDSAYDFNVLKFHCVFSQEDWVINHFYNQEKSLKLLNWNNIFEFRLPVYLSVFGLYSFCLKLNLDNDKMFKYLLCISSISFLIAIILVIYNFCNKSRN